MSESIRRTKSSLKECKRCYDALLLGLTQPKDLCRPCKNYFDLPVKKKPQCDMGVLFSRCERPQINGISPNAITTIEDKKRKEVYCQLVSTPAPTKRVLLLSTSELSSSCRGRPSMKTIIEETRACYSTQVAFYKNASREKDDEKVRLQEELERTREELARVQDKCNLLENDVVRLESCRRRSNESKQNQAAITHINDPYKAAAAFLNNISVKDKAKNSSLVSGVVRALASKKNTRSMYFKQCRSTYHKYALNLK